MNDAIETERQRLEARILDILPGETARRNVSRMTDEQIRRLIQSAEAEMRRHLDDGFVDHSGRAYDLLGLPRPPGI